MDTNVVSELTSDRPDANVLAWFAKQKKSDFFITAITEAELLFGVENLPFGSYRDALLAGDRRMVDEVLGGRVLSFDRQAARYYAEIRAVRERLGRRISHLDCMIAAIARVHGATVATRDVGGFRNCGIDVVNPWTD